LISKVGIDGEVILRKFSSEISAKSAFLFFKLGIAGEGIFTTFPFEISAISAFIFPNG
jgi:hypothetical protein